MAPGPKLLTLVRRAIRLRHYSQHTEEAYVAWVRRFVRFAGLRHPSELGEVGTFRLVQVITSWSTDSAELSATRSWLSLAPTDSAQRATAGDRRLGRLSRPNLQLIGSWRAAVDTHTYQPAELDAGVLYVGCRDCTDASPDYLHIAAVGPRGFWGTWQNLQTGIGQ